jgi:hypothetical protein
MFGFTRPSSVTSVWKYTGRNDQESHADAAVSRSIPGGSDDCFGDQHADWLVVSNSNISEEGTH